MNSSGQKVCKILDGRVGMVEQDDRISQLPDDLLHYVLSFVEIVNVVGLSVLSKRWRNLWTTMPFLDFDSERFRVAKLYYLPSSIEKFRNFFNWVLSYQGSSSLTRFRISSWGSIDYEQLMRWVWIAARRGVQELEIKYDRPRPYSFEIFELPYSLSLGQCLHVLRLNLYICALQLPRNVNYTQLKYLELERAYLPDELFMPDLLSRCKVLEKLCLRNCILLAELLCIASDSLKYLIIEYFPEDERDGNRYCGFKLEVSCPTLFSFSYSAPKPNKFMVGDLSSLEILYLDIYPEFRNYSFEVFVSEVFNILKEIVNIRSLCLKIDAMATLVGEFDRIKGLETIFHRLKSLSLSIGIDESYTQTMFLLLKNCPSLEHLTITLEELDSYHHKWNWQLDDEGSNLWKYHLKSIELVNFADHPDDTDFAKFVLKNGLVLEKFSIVWMEGSMSVATENSVLRTSKASSVVAVRFR